MSSFWSMGTDVRVLVPSLSAAREGGLTAAVAEIFAENERRFSRFRPDSELSRLNAAEQPFPVSAQLFDVLRRARRYFEHTGGLFDPTIGAALIALGYDRPFAPGALDRRTKLASVPRCSFADILLDESTRTVTKPPHVQLDLGGIVKGWTVDAAAEILPCPAAIDAGGDASLRGDGPDGTGWIVDIEDPQDPRRTLLNLVVRDGAVATSGANRRRWAAGGEMVHHLIDPRTGRCAASDLAQVTVLAATAERAEVLAKAAFVLGARDGERFLESMRGVSGVLVRVAGGVRHIGDIEACHA